MANISQIKKSDVHTVTANEANVTFVALIPILWSAPFNDTNYAIAWMVEVLSQAAEPNLPGVSVYTNGIINKTGAGFTAVVGDFFFTAGDRFVVHAMASHR